MAIEITMEEFMSSYDWGEVFNGSVPDPCPPTSNVDTSPPRREDVAEIVAAVNGENDGDEWVGVFRLRDGRFLMASGWCDYTGWDCQSGTTHEVAKTIEEIVTIGLNDEQRKRLGLSPPESK